MKNQNIDTFIAACESNKIATESVEKARVIFGAIALGACAIGYSALALRASWQNRKDKKRAAMSDEARKVLEEKERLQEQAKKDKEYIKFFHNKKEEDFVDKSQYNEIIVYLTKAKKAIASKIKAELNKQYPDFTDAFTIATGSWDEFLFTPWEPKETGIFIEFFDFDITASKHAKSNPDVRDDAEGRDAIEKCLSLIINMTKELKEANGLILTYAGDWDGGPLCLGINKYPEEYKKYSE